MFEMLFFLTVPAIQDEMLEENRFNDTVDFIMEQFEETETGKSTDVPCIRLITMSPLYPCREPCSTGTHHETVKNLTLFSSIINGITMKSQLRINVFNPNSITFTP